MNFDLSEDQQLLKDTFERFLKQSYGFEQRKAACAMPEGWSREIWRQMAEIGLTGLLVPEAHGGFGGGKVEAMVALEALGSALVVEPFLPTAVLCTHLIAHYSTPAIAEEYLPGIVDGSALLALAHMERQTPLDLANVATTAKPSGDGFVLNGEKTLVLHGDSAHALIVSARVSGNQTDRAGIGLFLVDAKAPGLKRQAYATQDDGRAAEISLYNVPARALGEAVAKDGLPALEATIDLGMACLCVEAVGAMAALHALTVDYLKMRKQFGLPIGAFQVLQHRAADMYIALELARSMAISAMMSTDEPDAHKRHQSIAAAKVQIGRAGMMLGEEATQLHGGIGMTMEYASGHYFKRLTMIDAQWGDADHHLGQLAMQGSLLSD